MRSCPTLLVLSFLPRLASAASEDTGESALVILLLLGLAAVIAGLSNIRDLRRKHMLPPRPRDKAHHDDPANKPSKPSC